MNLRWSYGFSLMIDATLFLALGIPILTLFLNMNPCYGEAILGFCILFCLLTFYMILSPLQFKNASVGMKIMGIRIVDINGDVPSRKAVILRSLSIIAIAREDWYRVLYGEDMDGAGLRSTGTQIEFAGDARDEKCNKGVSSEPTQKSPARVGALVGGIASLLISLILFALIAASLLILGDFSVFGDSVKICMAAISIVSILLSVICPFIVLRSIVKLMR